MNSFQTNPMVSAQFGKKLHRTIVPIGTNRHGQRGSMINLKMAPKFGRRVTGFVGNSGSNVAIASSNSFFPAQGIIAEISFLFFPRPIQWE